MSYRPSTSEEMIFPFGRDLAWPCQYLGPILASGAASTAARYLQTSTFDFLFGQPLLLEERKENTVRTFS